MHARPRFGGSPEQVQEGIAHYEAGITSFSEVAGNRGAFLLVDQSSGKGIGVTLWESEAAMQAAGSAGTSSGSTRLQEGARRGRFPVEGIQVAVWAVS